MSILDNISYFKKQKEQLQQDVSILEQKKKELESNIITLQQTNNEEREKQKQLKVDNEQLKTSVNELTENKNELDEMLKNRKKMFIETELKYIDHLDGWSFEKYCSDLFTKLGFSSIVTKGSSDYGGDIIATYDNEQYIIQCKRYNDPISAKPIGEVLRSMKHYKCEKGVIVTNSTFTANAIEEAKDCNIELWDRNTLVNYLGIAYKFDLSAIDLVKYGINNVKDVNTTMKNLEQEQTENSTFSDYGTIFLATFLQSIKDGNIAQDEKSRDYILLHFDVVELAIKKGEVTQDDISRHFKFPEKATQMIIDSLLGMKLIEKGIHYKSYKATITIDEVELARTFIKNKDIIDNH